MAENLCNFCLENVYDKVDFGGQEDLWNYTGATKPCSLSSLRIAAGNGCPMCALVLDEMDVRQSDLLAGLDDGQMLELHIYSPRPSDSRLVNMTDVDCRVLMIAWSMPGQSPEYGDGDHSLVLVSQEGSHSSQSIKTRDDRLDLTSGQAMITAADWIENCISKHDICGSRRHAATPGPGRLIRVSGITKEDAKSEDDLQLVPSERLSTPPVYMTLSYCWGGPQEFVTLLSNIAHRLKGFSSTTITGAVRDAIVVARKLDIEYLWVDALCIIQDSEEDKAREIATMPQIYQESTITLVAEDNVSAREAFLTTPDGRKVWKLPYLCPDNFWDTVQIHKISNVKKSIDRRAWTMQEDYLSRRKLIFGKSTMSWKCYEFEKLSLSHRAQPPVPNSRMSGQIPASVLAGHYRSRMAAGLEGPSLEEGRSNAGAPWWIRIVNEYSERAITQDEDRLRAIGALAANEADLLGHTKTYVAGLWLEWLAAGLCWKRGQGFRDTTSLTVHPRPATYVAPSWSWASVVGGCTWHVGELSFEKTKTFVTNLDCKIEHNPLEGQYGQVIKGSLSFSGLAATCNVISMGDIKAREVIYDCIQTQKACADLELLLNMQWAKTYITADALESWYDILNGTQFILLARHPLHHLGDEPERDQIMVNQGILLSWPTTPIEPRRRVGHLQILTQNQDLDMLVEGNFVIE